MATAIKNSDRLLLQWIGGIGQRGYVTLLDIINWGEPHGEDSIKYITHDGEKIAKLNSFSKDNCIKIVKIEDIDVEKSLFQWYRNHNGESSKPLVYDENLTSGERYYGNCWRIGLLISSTETEVKYNFIFD